MFFFSSKVTGKVGKAVQFGVPWHMPQCLVDFIKTKQYTHVNTDKNGEVLGVEMRKAYSVVELEPLTQKELDELAKQQAARG